MAKQKEPARFEELLDELSRVVKELESDELGIEEAMEKYEKGMALSRECHKRLDIAERKLELLRRGPDGGVKSEPFSE